METSNILLITNNKTAEEKLCANLVLLRKNDALDICKYENAKDAISGIEYKMVILHEHDDKDITEDFIKYIRVKLPGAYIILLADKLDYDNILNFYDIGANDYFTQDADRAEILIKCINGLRACDKNNEIIRSRRLLQQAGILSMREFFSEKYAQIVFENELMKKSVRNGSFLIVINDEKDKDRFDFEKLCAAVQRAVRYDDIVFEVKFSKCYILLPKTDINGAQTVFKKISDLLQNEFDVKAGISDIKNRNFSEIERRASAALTDAILKDMNCAVFCEEQADSDDWLSDEAIEPKKDFKLFKLAFAKKLEKVISPVFYRLQKTYEDKLKNTKIEQYTNETQCVFSLINPLQRSNLKIIYPGLGKVYIYITHEGLDSPENREIAISLNKISQKYLNDIAEDFIKEYSYVIAS